MNQWFPRGWDFFSPNSVKKGRARQYPDFQVCFSEIVHSSLTAFYEPELLIPAILLTQQCNLF